VLAGRAKMKKIFKNVFLIFVIIITTISFAPSSIFANGGTFGFESYSDSPLEPSYFILWADNCDGLPYEFVITENSTEVYKETGTINNNQWYKLIETTLLEGDYNLKLTVNSYAPAESTLQVINWHGNDTRLDVNTGSSCTDTIFNMGCKYFVNEDEWYLRVKKYLGSGTWGEGYSFNGVVDDDPWTHSENLLLGEGLYLATFNIHSAHDYEIFSINSCNKSDSSVEIEEPVWIRDHEMTCYQVWINEDNNFEFVFWWEYANNNWVKIYDMNDNEVFSIDMEKGNAHFEAVLPDGMYTVKTFHNGFETPIQEFLIGKP
jgi:hypothetical protein